MNSFTSVETEQKFKETATQNNLKPGEALPVFRVLLTGQSTGVDLFPMTELSLAPQDPGLQPADRVHHIAIILDSRVIL